MGDAPRLTDERLAEIIREMEIGLFEASFQETLSIARELIERRAQSEGAQAKVVEHDWREEDGALTCSRCGLGYTNIQCISPPRLRAQPAQKDTP